MLKQILVCALLLTMGVVGSAVAQNAPKPSNVPMPPVTPVPLEEIDEVSGIKYPAPVTVVLRPGDRHPTSAQLTEIVAWLSSNFGLPAIHDHHHPRVEFVPPAKLVAIRYKGLMPDRITNDPAAQTNYQRDVLAVYNDSAKAIFLSDGWKGTNTADLSVLVHEMVHHLQNLAGLKYECTQAREKLAYQAQNEWLKLHGRDLEQEFEIDMLTLLVSSACMN